MNTQINIGFISDCLKEITQSIDEEFATPPYNKDQLEKLFESTELFITIITTLKRSQQFQKELALQAETIRNLQFHLLSVLKAIRSAVSTNDDVALQDLIVNELKDNLTQWRINVLTNLKKQPAQASILMNP